MGVRERTSGGAGVDVKIGIWGEEWEIKWARVVQGLRQNQVSHYIPPLTSSAEKGTL